MPEPESIAASASSEYEELTTSCWHQDPTVRPTFLEIMTRLSSMHGDSSTAMGGLSFTSRTSNTSSSSQSGGHRRSSSRGSLHSNGSASSSSANEHDLIGTEEVCNATRAPDGDVTIVFTDITRAASLWEFNPQAMRDATILHNSALRKALPHHRGYEVVFIRDRNSGEGSFCMAFHTPAEALAWCCEVQRALLEAAWPEALLEHPGAAEEWGDTDDRYRDIALLFPRAGGPPDLTPGALPCRVLFKGLRVRMGMHAGTPRMVRDPTTRRVEYIGPVVNAAARITALTHGGQIVLSEAVFDRIKGSAEQMEQHRSRLFCLGKFEMPDAPQGRAVPASLRVA